MNTQSTDAKLQGMLEKIVDAPYERGFSGFIWGVTPEHLRTSKIPDKYLYQLNMDVKVKTDKGDRNFSISHLVRLSRRAAGKFHTSLIHVSRNRSSTDGSYPSLQELNEFTRYLGSQVQGEVEIKGYPYKSSNALALNTIYLNNRLNHQRLADLFVLYRRILQGVTIARVIYDRVPKAIFDAGKRGKKGFGSPSTLEDLGQDHEAYAVSNLLLRRRLNVTRDSNGQFQFRNRDGRYASSKQVMPQLLHAINEYRLSIEMADMLQVKR